jgi:hypothetical protein
MQQATSPFAHLAGLATLMRNKPVEPSSKPQPAASSVAEQIIRAGAKRRGEIFVGTAPEQPQGYRASALEILNAGKKARGEIAT